MLLGQSPAGRNFGWAIPIERLSSLATLDTPLTRFDKLPALKMLRTGYSAAGLKVGQRVGELIVYENMYAQLVESVGQHTAAMERFAADVDAFRRSNGPKGGGFSFDALKKLQTTEEELEPLDELADRAKMRFIAPLLKSFERELGALDPNKAARLQTDFGATVERAQLSRRLVNRHVDDL